MRKATTILLLTVFCNSLFYYGYLSCALLKAKLEAKLAVARIDPRSSTGILRVPVSQLQKDESDEVWYEDKLYDVVEREVIKGTAYVFLERDEQEQNFLTRQQQCLKASCGLHASGGHELTATKLSLPSIDTECMQSHLRGVTRCFSMVKVSSARDTAPNSADFSETASPPPKSA